MVHLRRCHCWSRSFHKAPRSRGQPLVNPQDHSGRRSGASATDQAKSHVWLAQYRWFFFCFVPLGVLKPLGLTTWQNGDRTKHGNRIQLLQRVQVRPTSIVSNDFRIPQQHSQHGSGFFFPPLTNVTYIKVHI